MALAEGAPLVFTFGDDRVERWTLACKRYVVDH